MMSTSCPPTSSTTPSPPPPAAAALVAATTTEEDPSASTACLLFCLYPVASKQRLGPHGCCDGGGVPTTKEKNEQIQKYKDSGTAGHMG